MMGIALCLAPFLCACTPHDGQSPVSQTLARVNGREITVHQVNYLLQNPAAAAETAAADPRMQARAALDQLIEQEVLVQAAIGQKLDRNPDVLAALESARRAVLAHAYLEQISAAASRPSAADIHAYFENHPALFSQRRIYTLREIRIFADSAAESAAAAGKEAQLRSLWERSHSWDALLAAVRSAGDRHTSGTQILAAEQLPLDQVEEFQKLPQGAIRFSRAAGSLLVQQVTTIAREPMNEAHAGPMIEAYLLAQVRQEATQAEVARLKAAAQIDRMGELAAARADPAPGHDAGRPRQ